MGTLRTEEIQEEHPVKALCRALRQTGSLTEIELAPLSSEDTARLGSLAAGRDLVAMEAAHLYQETEGNPLFVVETVREGTTDPTRLPIAAQAVIAARLSRVTQASQPLLEIAATIGREFSFDLLARASERTEEAVLRGMDELWRRRILREHNIDSYEFSHEKLRQVAYSRMRPVRRRILHRRIAQTLEEPMPSCELRHAGADSATL